MKVTRTLASLLALILVASTWAQAGRDLVVKSLTLTIASSKSFCGGGRPVGHTGTSERMFFKPTGEWKTKLPDVDQFSVGFANSKASQSGVFLKLSASQDAALKEFGLGHARLGPISRAAPKRFQGQPLTPEMLATYPGVQTVTGFKLPGVTHVQLVAQAGRETQLIFWGK